MKSEVITGLGEVTPTVHSYFGPVHLGEWCKFYFHHFNHHFKQFELLPI